jgi:hypothetical protein
MLDEHAEAETRLAAEIIKLAPRFALDAFAEATLLHTKTRVYGDQRRINIKEDRTRFPISNFGRSATTSKQIFREILSLIVRLRAPPEPA